MPLSDWQKNVDESNARFKVIVAGRRAGKTYLAMRELAKYARFPNQQVFYVAPTFRQAKQTVWTPLKNKLRELNWIDQINESELNITLVNGSTIGIRGANKPSGLRGIGLHGLIMDEFSYIKQEAFTEVLRPTLSDTGGSAMFITTPAGKGNWSYDMFQKGQIKDDKEWQSWQYTTLDGGRVSEEEIEQARKDLDERTFRQEYEASFETYAGQIYYAFDTNNNVVPYRDNPDDLKTIYIAADFNISPITASISAKTDFGLHFFDEIQIYSSNTDELVQEIKNRYPYQRVHIFPDPAGVQRRTSAGGRTDISILENAGFTVRYRRRHPAVRDRINAVNSAIHSGKILFDPKCKNVINGLQKQTYKEGTQIPDKDSGYDHFNDGVGYKVEYLFPIKKEQPEFDETSTWGVGTL